MAIVKHIRDNSGSGKEFESVTTSEVTYDTTPQLGSFNPVTSDGIFKSIAGASGEVPAVNPGDAGKVLTAGFDGDTPTVSWEESQGGVPEYSSSDEGKVLKVSNGQASWQPDSMPYYDYMRIGQVLGVTGDPDKQESRLSWVNPPTPTVSTSDVMSGDGSAGNPVVLNYTNAFKPIPKWGAWTYNLSISSTGGITLPTETVINLFNGAPVRVLLYSTYTPQNYHWYIDDPSVTYTRGITRVVISKDGTDYKFYMQAVQGIDPAITLGTDGTYKGIFGNTDLYWTGAVNSLYSQGTAEYAISLLEEGGTAVLDWVPTDNAWFTPVTGLTYACNYSAGMFFSGYAVRTGMQLELNRETVPYYDELFVGKVLGVVDISGTAELRWKEGIPSTAGVPNSAVLAMGNSGMEWVEGGVPSYMNITTGTVSISRDNTVVTSTADMTSIIVGANVKSAVVQWTVNSTTTLPTVTDGTNPLKASVNNPASLTVGRTVQVSILNGTWVCAEFA